jgi:hypothetical protein
MVVKLGLSFIGKIYSPGRQKEVKWRLEGGKWTAGHFLYTCVWNPSILKHQENWKNYKVVQIWPGQTVTCLHTNSHIWTTLYMTRNFRICSLGDRVTKIKNSETEGTHESKASAASFRWTRWRNCREHSSRPVEIMCHLYCGLCE